MRVNDKVMQIRNNYDKDVFNGDIGRVVRIDPVDQEVVIRFDDLELTYSYSDLDQIILAYAISVHKSQGSEYPAVVIPILTQHYLLLQRNLIYTAITRGRNLVIMVGTRKALAMAVGNSKPQRRFTHLQGLAAAEEKGTKHNVTAFFFSFPRQKKTARHAAAAGFVVRIRIYQMAVSDFRANGSF